MSGVVEKLVEARELIERGWTQGYYTRPSPFGPRYCAEGALAMQDGLCDAEHFLRRAIGEYNIITWNDAPERTQAEVLAAFDKAIDLAESAQ